MIALALWLGIRVLREALWSDEERVVRLVAAAAAAFDAGAVGSVLEAFAADYTDKTTGVDRDTLRAALLQVLLRGRAGAAYRAVVDGDQIRVVGQAAKPQSLPYRANMTVLDVIIAVGGLAEFAAGNRAVIVRQEGGKQLRIPVRLNDLINDGDISANQPVRPGDVISVD